MAAENGCLTITQQQVTAGTVSVTPSIAPMAGTANARRTVGPAPYAAVLDTPLVAAAVGPNLVITLARGRVRAGDMLCWTSYS